MDVRDGIYVTVVGMALVFSALTTLMLAIMVLKRLLRPREEEVADTPAYGGPGEETAAIAALAVGIALAFSETQKRYAPEPVHVLSVRQESGAWKAYSKLQSTE